MTKIHHPHPHTPPSTADHAPTQAYQQTVEQALAAQRSTMAGLSRAEAQARLDLAWAQCPAGKKSQTGVAAFSGPF